jgi:hypothetical protein
VLFGIQKSRNVMEFLLDSYENYTDAPTFYQQFKSMILYEFSSEIEVMDNILPLVEMALNPNDPCIKIM